MFTTKKINCFLSFLLIMVFLSPIIAHSDRGVDIVSTEGVQVFQTGKRYAILIGISKYSRSDLNLKYATNDVNSLNNLLSDKEYGGYDKIKIITDSQAKSLNIRKALMDLDRIITSQDTILFFYAGHGVLVNGETYLLPHDAELDYIELTSIKLKDIVNIITKTSAKQKILLLDACHSGGAIDSKVYNQRNIQNINLDNLQSSKGIVILSSSRSGEPSYEDDDAKHGLFTKYVVKGLKGEADQYKTGNKNGFVEAQELYSYVNEEANNEAMTKINRSQHASMAGHVEGPFYLTYYIDFAKYIEEQKSPKFVEEQRKREYIEEQRKLEYVKEQRKREEEKNNQEAKPVRRYVPVFN